MEIWIVLECGYEEGAIEIIGAYQNKKTAEKKFREMMKNRDPIDCDWLWYDIKSVQVQ